MDPWPRQKLPDRQPYHVWTNFEFPTHNGQVHEIDAFGVNRNDRALLEPTLDSIGGLLADVATMRHLDRGYDNGHARALCAEIGLNDLIVARIWRSLGTRVLAMPPHQLRSARVTLLIPEAPR